MVTNNPPSPGEVQNTNLLDLIFAQHQCHAAKDTDGWTLSILSFANRHLHFLVSTLMSCQ